MAAGPCRAAAGLGAASTRVQEGYRAATQAGVEEEKRGGRTGATASGDHWEERPTARRDRLGLGPGKRKETAPGGPLRLRALADFPARATARKVVAARRQEQRKSGERLGFYRWRRGGLVGGTDLDGQGSSAVACGQGGGGELGSHGRQRGGRWCLSGKKQKGEGGKGALPMPFWEKGGGRESSASGSWTHTTWSGRACGNRARAASGRTRRRLSAATDRAWVGVWTRISKSILGFGRIERSQGREQYSETSQREMDNLEKESVTWEFEFDYLMRYAGEDFEEKSE
uniref:Uncharacterized protein n=1 Tax=Oryza sativa subsp. japonica TaxID=39947 RepID=Q6H7B8_ORYSJ|nr:hypothetical protein [Oryza sativa Japonica Group]